MTRFTDIAELLYAKMGDGVWIIVAAVAGALISLGHRKQVTVGQGIYTILSGVFTAIVAGNITKEHYKLSFCWCIAIGYLVGMTAHELTGGLVTYLGEFKNDPKGFLGGVVEIIKKLWKG